MQTFSTKDSTWKLSLMVLAALGFVILGLWIGGIFGEPPKPGREWLGWICALFFGSTGGIALRRLWNPIDTIPWPEISTLSVWQFKGQKSILLNLRNPERFPSTTLLGKLAGANRALTGSDITLNLAGTDKSFDDAMSVIDHFLSGQHSKNIPAPTGTPTGFGKRGL